jgi:hypothetical protein
MVRRGTPLAMPVQGSYTGRSMTDTPPLPEYTDVVLIRAYQRGGLSLPQGAEGVIVDVHLGARSYSIDFAAPYDLLESVPMDAVAAIQKSE